MSEQSTIGVYDSLAHVEEAVRRLDGGGFPNKRVSIVGQNTERERHVQGYVTDDDLAKKGAGTGAAAGGLLGLLTMRPLPQCRVLGESWWLAYWLRRFWNFWAV